MYAYVDNVIGVSVTPGPKVVLLEFLGQFLGHIHQLKQLKPRAECALWFTKSYGLEVDSIQKRDGDGLRHNVHYRNSDQISTDRKETFKRTNNKAIAKMLFRRVHKV